VKDHLLAPSLDVENGFQDQINSSGIWLFMMLIGL